MKSQKPLLKQKLIMKIPNKFKNISAVTFTTYGKELMICFDGFENENDMKDFADFVFAKIKMNYINQDKVPTFH